MYFAQRAIIKECKQQYFKEQQQKTMSGSTHVEADTSTLTLAVQLMNKTGTTYGVYFI